MKQTTKNILGVAAIVILSSGVAGVTTYKMLNKEKPATFGELFQQTCGWPLTTQRMRSLLI